MPQSHSSALTTSTDRDVAILGELATPPVLVGHSAIGWHQLDGRIVPLRKSDVDAGVLPSRNGEFASANSVEFGHVGFHSITNGYHKNLNLGTEPSNMNSLGLLGVCTIGMVILGLTMWSLAVGMFRNEWFWFQRLANSSRKDLFLRSKSRRDEKSESLPVSAHRVIHIEV
jgi:hypothetical protein